MKGKAKNIKIGQSIYMNSHWVKVDKIEESELKNGKKCVKFEGYSITTREKFGYECRLSSGVKSETLVSYR